MPKQTQKAYCRRSMAHSYLAGNQDLCPTRTADLPWKTLLLTLASREPMQTSTTSLTSSTVNIKKVLSYPKTHLLLAAGFCFALCSLHLSFNSLCHQRWALLARLWELYECNSALPLETHFPSQTACRTWHITSSLLISSLEKVSPGIRPLFFSQNIAAKEPEKKMPSTAAKATTLSPVLT